MFEKVKETVFDLANKFIIMRTIGRTSVAVLLLVLIVIPVTLKLATKHTSTSGNASYENIYLKAVSQGKTYGLGENKLILPDPGPASSGDVLIAQISAIEAVSINPPPGWVLIRKDQGRGNMLTGLYYHVFGINEPDFYAWSFNVKVSAEGGIADYSGVNTSVPVDSDSGCVGSVQAYTPVPTGYAPCIGRPTGKTAGVPGRGCVLSISRCKTQALLDVPSVKAHSNSDMLIFFASVTGPLDITMPLGMKSQWMINSKKTGIYMSDQLLTKSGESGNRTAIVNGEIQSVVVSLVALNP